MPRKKIRTESQPAPAKPSTGLLAGYEDLLAELKSRIRTAQIRAALSVNREMIALYWEIGRDIVARQEKAGWGDEILERLSHDLRHEFPDMQGFSRTNLYRMRAFYLAYPEQPEFVPQVVGQIPWGHNQVLLEKLKDRTEREWYAQQTIQYGWSRAVLVHHIKTRLYQRQA
ncbi:MAG: DUF1016 N-terminal domain-containing protein [Acidobacteriota bacterium]|nr:DUF1016 N-terminal domain-containing protein [Acidobacteriota bacterium]